MSGSSRPLPGLSPPRPIPLRERIAMIFLERGRLDVLDGAFVLVDDNGVRVHIPVGGLACLMLEPGTRVSHAAVALAARAGTLLIWVGEAGVRLYAAGQPGGARSDRLLYQARLALDDDARLRVVRKMYALRFGEEAPSRCSLEQLRGIRVRGGRGRRSGGGHGRFICMARRPYFPTRTMSTDRTGLALARHVSQKLMLGRPRARVAFTLDDTAMI